MSVAERKFFQEIERQAHAAEISRQVFETLRNSLEKLHPREVVIIEPQTGKFVVRPDRASAQDEFDQVFGSGTFGFEVCIGEEAIVGDNTRPL